MYSPPKILLPLLWPLSLVYGAVVVVRAWLYMHGILKQKRLNGVVISVGNLTVGGTGKTPMVLWLADQLRSDNVKQAILIRGYRGSGGFSDEANLLRNRVSVDVEVGVGPNRWEAGSTLEHRGCQQFILDDGFQHLQLARDIDIVLIDATDPFGGRHMLPAGRLREPRSALSRADIVVITRSSHAPAIEAAIRRYTMAPIFYARMQFRRLETFVTLPSSQFQQGPEPRYFAFSGLGNSDAFFADIRAWGLEVVGQRAFPDHHKYTKSDLAGVVDAAKKAGAVALVCTEKDSQNLDYSAYESLQGFGIAFCVASLDVSDAAGFLSTLHTLIAARRARSGEVPR